MKHSKIALVNRFFIDNRTTVIIASQWDAIIFQKWENPSSLIEFRVQVLTKKKMNGEYYSGTTLIPIGITLASLCH